VWVSADGGHTWGQCVAEASFSDRRWQTTILDNLGYFLLIGGEEVEGGVYAKQNDVWKSSFPMTNKARVAKACKITYPQCQATGLSCWPGSTAVKRDSSGQVTCATLTSFCNREDESSTGTDWWESSTGFSPTCCSNSTNAGLIALIVILIIAGVGAIGGYIYYSRKHSVHANPIPSIGTDGLLAPIHTDSAASSSDYYAAPQETVPSSL